MFMSYVSMIIWFQLPFVDYSTIRFDDVKRLPILSLVKRQQRKQSCQTNFIRANNYYN